MKKETFEKLQELYLNPEKKLTTEELTEIENELTLHRFLPYDHTKEGPVAIKAGLKAEDFERQKDGLLKGNNITIETPVNIMAEKFERKLTKRELALCFAAGMHKWMLENAINDVQNLIKSGKIDIKEEFEKFIKKKKGASDSDTQYPNR